MRRASQDPSGNRSRAEQNKTAYIGHFALFPATRRCLCLGQACVIAGSELSLRHLVDELAPTLSRSPVLLPTTLDEIRAGLRLGGTYALDEEAWHRLVQLTGAEDPPDRSAGLARLAPVARLAPAEDLTD